MTFSARPRKRFGQHWLRSETILGQIIGAAELGNHDCVLEIGPGTGMLTKKLLAIAGTVIAIEVDYDLCRQLQHQFATVDNFLLLQGDVLQLDLEAQLLAHSSFPAPNKVVANIPYYITGPILEKLLGSPANPNANPFESIVLLVQKEIAERLSANPGSKIFGSLSVNVQYLATCEMICHVPPSAFQPPPKVASAVVRLRPRQFPLPAQDPAFLEQLVKLGFSRKRKMLRNNLADLVDRSQLLPLLAGLGIPENVRAEELSIVNWVTLSNKILESCHLL